MESKKREKNDTNGFIYKTEIDSQTLETNIWSPNGKWGRDKLGDWDKHTTTWKTDKQQGPAA